MSLLSRCLAWFGVLPFLIAILMVAFESTLFSVSGEQMFVTYSAIILTFMAGTLWGQCSHKSDTSNATPIVVSNIWAIIAWLCVILIQVNEALLSVVILLLALGFVHILIQEKKAKLLAASESYLMLRTQVTCKVIILHLLLLLFMFLDDQYM